MTYEQLNNDFIIVYDGHVYSDYINSMFYNIYGTVNSTRKFMEHFQVEEVG